MPNIDCSKKDLEALVGKKFSPEQLEAALQSAKGEIGAQNGDALTIEIGDANRPDLWSAEGIARVLRSACGKEKGAVKIQTKKSNWKLIIDESVQEVRPVMVAAIARNVKVNENFLVQMIQLQEKVGMSFGRRRKETGIGLYDLDKITPPVHYKAFSPRSIKFVPLEFDNEMDLDEILELHPKGIEFGHLIKGHKKYPIVIDSKNIVCSMPPIINSNYTGKVTPETKNLFIEVTGFSREICEIALNVMCAALAERGAKIEQVQIQPPKGKSYWTPEFSLQQISVPLEYIRKISGMELKNAEILKLLERVQYDAKINGKNVEIEYAPLRNDILHPIDVVEDLLIAYGYNKIETEKISLPTQGREQKKQPYLKLVREACVGLGLQEIMTFVLTSKDKQNSKMRQNNELVELENPVSENYAVMRASLAPELLEFLFKNKDAEIPINLFEVGKTIEFKAGTETGTAEKDKLCIALCDSSLNVNAGKSILQSLEKAFGEKWTLKESVHASYIEGRFALVQRNGKTFGVLGEVHPQILENFGLKNPVVVLELEI